MLDLTSIDSMLSRPRGIPLVGSTHVWPSMLSTSLISTMGSSYAPGTSLVVGNTLFALPWNPLEWDLTHYVFRLIIRSTGRTRSVSFVTLGKSRTSLTLFFVVPFSMRSERDSMFFRECQSLPSFFKYIDQQCLALYLQETMQLREHTIQLQPCLTSTPTQLITSFFSPTVPA